MENVPNSTRKMGNSAIFGGNRYLVPFNRGIATTSVRTGLAMTALFFKQQFVVLLSQPDKHICNYFKKSPEAIPQLSTVNWSEATNTHFPNR